MTTIIVIDTSVFIGALISATGANRELIRRCLRREYQPLMGNALFSEYESVMNRQEIIAKCPITKEEKEALFAALISVSRWISIYYLWRPNLQDEADNHLVELAMAGNARIIATNNLKDFRNSELHFPNLAILQPEDIIRG
ncbi:putative toxin-antitoxin system toxin component, PIN family [Pleurocapsales cyanobacterium LEGE 10410]|nr:putative toxin-antitoxin system toxin component, PIN family [Pleurocapsales cyanobacterium LEGE 10410]